MSDRCIICPHCAGACHMHRDPSCGSCVFCDGTGRMDKARALTYAALNRTIADEGVICGDTSPSRAAELLREAGEIEAFFATGAACPQA